MTGFQEDLTEPCIVFIIPWRVAVGKPEGSTAKLQIWPALWELPLGCAYAGEVYKSEPIGTTKLMVKNGWNCANIMLFESSIWHI